MAKIFGGNFNNGGNSVQPTRDSGYIIAGYKGFMNTEGELYLIKTDDSGNKKWEKKFDLLQAMGNSIQQTSDDGYIIAGEIYLIKTDASGNIQWMIRENSQSAQQTFDGGYISIGGEHLIKTDTIGNIKWHKRLIKGTLDYACSIQETRDGGYIITGVKNSSGYSYDVYLIKTDSAGNLLWQKTFGGKESDKGFSVQQTLDGGYVIVGETESFDGGKSDVYLIKTDSIGNVTEKIRGKK